MLVTASRVFVASDLFHFSLDFNFSFSLPHTCTDKTDSQRKILPVSSYAMLAFTNSYISQPDNRYLHIMAKMEKPQLCLLLPKFLLSNSAQLNEAKQTLQKQEKNQKHPNAQKKDFSVLKHL